MYYDFEDVPDENVIIESPRSIHRRNKDILTYEKENKNSSSNENNKKLLTENKRKNILKNGNYICSMFMDSDTDNQPKKVTEYNQRFNCNKNTNINIYILPNNNEKIINNFKFKRDKKRKNALSQNTNDPNKEKKRFGIKKKILFGNRKINERMQINKGSNDENNYLLNFKYNLDSEDLFKNSVLIKEGQKYRMINSIKHSKRNTKTKGRLDNYSSSSSSSKFTKINKQKINNRSHSNGNSIKIDNNKIKISRNTYYNNNSSIKGNIKNILKSFNFYYPRYRNILFGNLLKTEISKRHFLNTITYKNSVPNYIDKKKNKYNNNFFSNIINDNSKLYDKFLNKKNRTVNTSSLKKTSRNVFIQEKIIGQKSNFIDNIDDRNVIRENDEFLKMQKAVTLTVIDSIKKKKNKPKKKGYHVINYLSNISSINANTNTNTTNSNTNRSSMTKIIPIDHKNEYNTLTLALSNKRKNSKHKINNKYFIDISSIINKIKNQNLRKNSTAVIKEGFYKSNNIKNNSYLKKKN